VFLPGFYVVRWRRPLAAANLARPFPEKTEAERATILKESYRNLGDMFFEVL
jgi:lauroyl/myristoyl acyltransferase